MVLYSDELLQSILNLRVDASSNSELRIRQCFFKALGLNTTMSCYMEASVESWYFWKPSKQKTSVKK